jgi:hypothetical protein
MYQILTLRVGVFYKSLGNLEKQGVFDAYNNAMDAIKSRLNGKSDGSLPAINK